MRLNLTNFFLNRIDPADKIGWANLVEEYLIISSMLGLILVLLFYYTNKNNLNKKLQNRYYWIVFLSGISLLDLYIIYRTSSYGIFEILNYYIKSIVWFNIWLWTVYVLLSVIFRVTKTTKKYHLPTTFPFNLIFGIINKAKGKNDAK